MPSPVRDHCSCRVKVQRDREHVQGSYICHSKGPAKRDNKVPGFHRRSRPDLDFSLASCERRLHIVRYQGRHDLQLQWSNCGPVDRKSNSSLHSYTVVFRIALTQRQGGFPPCLFLSCRSGVAQDGQLNIGGETSCDEE